MKIPRAMIRETRMPEDDPTEIQVRKNGILTDHNHDDPRIKNTKLLKAMS